MARNPHIPFLNLDRLIFGIGEISEISEVSTRQLRYWEQRGYIHSLSKKEGESRKYSFKTAIAILSIKHFLDEGFTLQTAATKMSGYTRRAHLIKKFFMDRFEGITEIDGLPAIDLGFLEDSQTQKVYGLIGEDKCKIVVLDIQNLDVHLETEE